jgi:hypothetical protein
MADVTGSSLIEAGGHSLFFHVCIALCFPKHLQITLFHVFWYNRTGILPCFTNEKIMIKNNRMIQQRSQRYLSTKMLPEPEAL